MAAAVLMTVYLASLAPQVTFWDAGEFTAAVHTLGIPHPPGTPLYILIGKAWSLGLGFLGTSLALNLLSAVCTAAAGALTARLVYRSTRNHWMAIGAAVIAGTMSTAWLNATETEVYAVSLLLSLLLIEAADHAGNGESWRLLVLAAYLIALAVPLHLSALIAAPAAMVLASERLSAAPAIQQGGGNRRFGGWLSRSFPAWRWSWTLAIAGVVLLAVAASGVSLTLVIAGLVLVAVAIALERQRVGWRTSSLLVSVAIALSALAFMIVRAQHDPGINQGDPSTMTRWIAVMTREQYDAAPMWPRQAPLWIQLGNMLQYFDWQMALSLAPEPPLSVGRGVMTLIAIVLGVIGSRAHRQIDARRWRAVLALLLSGSIGVMIYLNLKPGPSIGWGILPDDAPHEARERDYFFVLAFWAWAVWIAIGAVTLAARFRVPKWSVAFVALLPILLNWKAVERSSEPVASLARRSAIAFLSSSPARAVLFVAGDNDSYPLWYMQQVEGFRRDVTVVTIPIAPALWYLAELERRHGLRAPSEWRGLSAMLTALANDARQQGRPVAAAVSVEPRDRVALGDLAVLRGWVWVEADEQARLLSLGLRAVDVEQAIGASGLSSAERASVAELQQPVAPSTWRWLNSTERYMLGLLSCPRLAVESATREVAADSLDSTCNFR